jgi:hypothetical protein
MFPRRCFIWNRGIQWVFFVLTLSFLIACKKSSSDLPPAPVIQLPQQTSFYFHGEKIRVQAKVFAKANFSHLELYLAGDLVLETEHWAIDTLLDLPPSGEGIHLIRVIACDLQGNCSESSVEFEVLSAQGEPEDLETFTQEALDGWFLHNWTLLNEDGYDDKNSLVASSVNAIAITRKNFTEEGNISFFVKNSSAHLEFLVDGRVKARWFGEEDWGEYAYTIPPGEHVFKWVSREEGTFLDQVSFNPGQIRHTPGEHFGGGIIYHLDSTGQHGLIAALQDGTYQGRPEIPWGCYGVAITSGNRAQSESDGASNTRAIVSSCEMDQNAARYCYDYSIEQDASTWDDWYLPAITEVRLLYAQRHLMENLGGDYYWTSTSFSTHAASVIDFRDGSHHGAHRNIPNVSGPVAAGIYVRPVRGF